MRWPNGLLCCEWLISSLILHTRDSTHQNALSNWIRTEISIAVRFQFVWDLLFRKVKLCFDSIAPKIESKSKFNLFATFLLPNVQILFWGIFRCIVLYWPRHAFQSFHSYARISTRTHTMSAKVSVFIFEFTYEKCETKEKKRIDSIAFIPNLSYK